MITITRTHKYNIYIYIYIYIFIYIILQNGLIFAIISLKYKRQPGLYMVYMSRNLLFLNIIHVCRSSFIVLNPLLYFIWNNKDYCVYCVYIYINIYIYIYTYSGNKFATPIDEKALKPL